MKALMMSVLAASFAFGVVSGCGTAPKTEQAREQLQTDAEQTLAQFKQQDPTLDKVMDDAVGYAVYPSVGKGGLIAGGAFGRGAVYEEGKFIGYSDLKQASIGAQIGGQEFAQLMVFQTEEAFSRFKNNNFSFGADASAVALKSGAAASAVFRDGVAVFADAKSGLMASAALTGQQFTFLPKGVVPDADAATASDEAPRSNAATTQPSDR